MHCQYHLFFIQGQIKFSVNVICDRDFQFLYPTAQTNKIYFDHGLSRMSRGTSPWMSMDIHVLLNGIMVKDHGLTDHGQSPWSVKTWSSPWTSQGCPWTLTMVIIHGYPWTSMFC